MSDLAQFMEEISQYLYLTKAVTERQGSRINVGEKFSVRFTLTNTAPPVVTVFDRNVRFKTPYIMVVKTNYAKPYHPEMDDIYSLGNNFPVDALDPGESASLEFEFVATADIEGIGDWFLQEEIAAAYVNAHLDTDEYFKIMRQFNVRTEIYP